MYKSIIICDVLICRISSVVSGCVEYEVWGVVWCKPKLKCCCQGEREGLGAHTQP